MCLICNNIRERQGLTQAIDEMLRERERERERGVVAYGSIFFFDKMSEAICESVYWWW